MQAQLVNAMAALEGDMKRTEAVHDARKRIKKLRGLLRLVRPAFPDYAAENRTLRDAGRRIAPLRDSHVMVQTFDALMRDHADELDPEAFAPLRKELTSGRRQPRKKEADAAVAEVCRTLTATRDRAGSWFLSETGFDALAGGLKDTYRRVRRGAKLVPGKSEDSRLHDWRKAVKYHGYHTRLMRAAWPGPLAARRAELEELGDALGAHQDLAVFEARLQESSLGQEPARVLQGLVDRRKLEHARHAHALGRRLAAKPPKVLVRNWRLWWSVWQSEITERPE